MNKSQESGFTLIELLVSLAILAVALAVLFGAISASLDRARKSRDEAIATLLVQSLLARAQTAPALAAGETSGVYSNGYLWQLDVAPYGGDADRKAWRTRTYRLRATVLWEEGRQTRSRSLVALRIVPVAVP
jgi:type II secretion system protein I